MYERIQDLFPAKEPAEPVPETAEPVLEAAEISPEPAAEPAVETPREADPREVLDTLKRGTIVALLRLGASRRMAAREVHCHPATIARTAARDPDFADRLTKAESIADKRALESIVRAVEQERYWRAAAWMLERRNPEEFGRRTPNTFTAEQVMEVVARLVRVLLPAVPAAHRDEVMLEFNDTLSELSPLAGQLSPADRAARGATDCGGSFDVAEEGLSPARVEELRHANWDKTERWLRSLTDQQVYEAYTAAIGRVQDRGEQSAYDGWTGRLRLEWALRCDNRPTTYPGGVVKTNAEIRAEEAAAEAAARQSAQHPTTTGGQMEEQESPS